MADVKTKCVSLMSSTASVDFKTVATTNLYTVPTGKTFVPVCVIIHTPNASLAGGVVTFGSTTAKTSFLGSQTLTNIDGATKAATLMAVPNATPVACIPLTAGTIFCIDVTTGITAGSGTATV